MCSYSAFTVLSERGGRDWYRTVGAMFTTVATIHKLSRFSIHFFIEIRETKNIIYERIRAVYNNNRYKYREYSRSEEEKNLVIDFKTKEEKDNCQRMEKYLYIRLCWFSKHSCLLNINLLFLVPIPNISRIP